MLTTELNPGIKKDSCFDLSPVIDGPVRDIPSFPVECKETDQLVHERARRSGFPRTTIADSDNWDMSVFQPKSKVVSCYSGEIFSPGLKFGFSSLKPASGMMKPDCGAWIKKEQSEDQFRDIYHNCGSLSCPVCGWSEMIAKSNDVQERFENYELLKNAENAVLIPGEKCEYKPRHFVFTMSPKHESELIARTFSACGRWSESVFLDLARAEYHAGLKRSGLIGGVTVYHDARILHPDTGQTGKTGKRLIVMEAKLAGNMKDDDPSWKIYRHIAKQKERAGKYYYFSPHFHVIAYGKIIPVAEYEELCPGWTYHNKKEVKNAGGLAYYLFSHMAMIEDKKSVSWFGRLSSVHLGKEELRTYEQVEVCPETGKPWIIVESIYAGEIGKEHVNSVTEYGYFFRVHRPDELPLTPEERQIMFLKIIHSYPAYRRAMFDKQIKRGMAAFAPYQRPNSPAGVRETGILALAKFVDETGRL